MPRITIETKIPVKGDISEIKSMTYDLPSSIIYRNTLLTYDSHHQAYIGKDYEYWITPVEYVEMVLSKKEENQKTDNQEIENQL